MASNFQPVSPKNHRRHLRSRLRSLTNLIIPTTHRRDLSVTGNSSIPSQEPVQAVASLVRPLSMSGGYYEYQASQGGHTGATTWNDCHVISTAAEVTGLLLYPELWCLPTYLPRYLRCIRLSRYDELGWYPIHCRSWQKQSPASQASIRSPQYYDYILQDSSKTLHH